MRGPISIFLSMKLRNKVIAGYSFFTLLVFSILALIGVKFFRIKAHYDYVDRMSREIQLFVQLKSDINGARAAFLRMAVSKDPQVWDNQKYVIGFYIKSTDQSLSRLQNGIFGGQIREIESNWVPFKLTLKDDLVPLVMEGKTDQAISILGTDQARRSRAFMEVANQTIKSSNKLYSARIAAVNHDIRATIISVALIILVVFSLSFAVTFIIINKYMIKVLRNISESAEKVASGDLTVSLEAKTGDEFGKLANDVNRIISAMQAVLRKIAGKTAYILKDATDLTYYGKGVSRKVDQDLERTTTAAAATEEMSFSIGDIARNINTASQSAEGAGDASSKGGAIVTETVSSIGEVNTQITSASATVRDLAGLSKRIDEIVVLIKDIADQTNLLALNAAIEAARAGEHGRGFAVVADEVGKLAQRTANATNDINGLLGSVHSGVVQATDMMDVAVGKANSTSGLARKLEESFKVINDSFEQVSDLIREVVTTTDEQSATASEISKNLIAISENAKENSTTVKEMAMSFGKFNLNAREFLKILDDYTDPMMGVGVLKADYVLWFNRLLDLLDNKGLTISEDELHGENSRMGRWYCGEGKRLFGGTRAFHELEAPHRRLHELGLLAYEAARKGDGKAVKEHISQASGTVDEIMSILNRFDI